MRYERATDNSMRGLLRDMPVGVPVDCLLARIRGRRSFLLRDWDRLLLSRHPLAMLLPAPWRAAASGTQQRALQKEYYWVFSRMDEQLRHSTSPFFWLHEVRTIALCLRLMTKGATATDHLLEASLLANSIKELLRKKDGCASAVADLAVVLTAYAPALTGLEDIYHTGGHGELEKGLYEMSLKSLVHAPLHPQMLRYCAMMIDSRNLTTIAKRMRWRMASIPPLLEGGTLAPARLQELFRRRDKEGLLRLAMRLGGEAVYSESDDPERVLYQAEQRVMQRLARETGGIGVILDYLWRCGNEAVNIGLLERLESAGSEHVLEELQ